MGASIHMHIEVKKNGRWLHYSAPAINRDRTFFGMVAGLDTGIKPVVQPKGLPDDLSKVTLACLEQDKESYKVHHATWLDADELFDLQDALKAYHEPLGHGPLQYDLEYAYFNTYINGNSVARPQGWDDVRLVAWFDN